MSFKLPFFLIILSQGIFWGCSKDEVSVEPNPEPEIKPVNPPITIEFPNGKIPSLSFDASGGQKQLQFYVTGKWQAELTTTKSSIGWITFSPSSGDKGFHTIEVLAAANKEPDARNAILYLKTKDEKKLVSISQNERNIIEVDKDSVMVKYEGDSFQLNVKANVSYDVKVDVDWISLHNSKVCTQEQLAFVVLKNGKLEKRAGQIVLMDKDKSISKTVIVSQMGKDSSVDDWENGNNDWWKPNSR